VFVCVCGRDTEVRTADICDTGHGQGIKRLELAGLLRDFFCGGTQRDSMRVVGEADPAKDFMFMEQPVGGAPPFTKGQVRISDILLAHLNYF